MSKIERYISYGGGVQSSALIVLAATGRIEPVDGALFANTGDDSENPATIKYVREIITPWAASHGIPVHELQRIKKGNKQTLWGRIMDYQGDRLAEPIPVRGYTGRPLSRSCTVDHKIKVLERWVKQNVKILPVEMLIGISADEIERAKTGANSYEICKFPLLDLKMNRADCATVIKEAGLPVPPKSACFFCPFHTTLTWREMRRDSPELFAKAVALENKLNERRARLNKPPVYLSHKLRPLSEIITEAPDSLFADQEMAGQCDSGHCFI